MQFTDSVTVAGTRRTADGYLIATAKCVRTGIQVYTGDEVGRPDIDLVRVYRGADQVFAQDSLQSFSHAPITIDHPSVAVNSENFRSLAVGEVSTAAKKDGDWVSLPLILKDAAAIASVEGGKRELSAGYVCELEWTPGVTADGETFDAQQKTIRINHLALVDKARAGSQARIGDAADGGKDRSTWGIAPLNHDHKPKGADMTMSTVVLGDKAVQVAATDAPAIEAFKADAAKKIADAEKAHKDAIAAKDKELADRDAKIEDLEKKVLDDAALDQRVQARAKLVADAEKIAKDVKTEGISDADIRKAVVAAKLGDEKVKDRSEAYIEARFDGLLDAATEDSGATDPLRSTGGIKTTDGAGTWSDAAFKRAGVQMVKEA